MASNNSPDDFQVIESLQRILKNSDLTKLTRKEVRKSLEKELGGNFSSPYWKQRIKSQIEEFVRKKESGIDNHSNPMPTQKSDHYDNGHNGQQNKKRHRYSDEAGIDRNDDDYNPNPKRRRIDHNNNRHNNNNNGYNNNNNNNNNGVSSDNNGYPHNRRPRLQSNKQLIQKSPKDNSYYMKLPDNGGAKKRCIIHTYRRKLYVGFREYYEKGGEELPSKKGINLTEEQWDFVVKHIDDINAQIKTMKR